MLVDVPELPPLAVGEEREYRVTVNLDAPTIGTYRVEGTVVPDAAEPMTFSATITTRPWGLTAALAAVLIVLMVARRGRKAERRLKRANAQQ